MKIIQIKKINKEAAIKENLFLGLLLLGAGISTSKNIADKLNISKERLESAYSDTRNMITNLNNKEWYDMNPEDLNFGPFEVLSIPSRIKLQQEWKEFRENGNSREQALQEQADEYVANRIKQLNSLSQNIVARTLFHEARSDGESGMRDVASVLYNRSKRRGSSIHEECLRNKQFSYWNDISSESKSTIVDEANRYPAQADRNAWAIAQRIASELISGSFTPTIDADHYHTPAVSPEWSMGKTGEQRQSHIFYKLGY